MNNGVALSSENIVLNAVGFQLSWWGIALYKEKAILPVLILVCFHLLFLKKRRKEEAFFIVGVALLGVCMDSFLFDLGIFRFEQSLVASSPIVPLWLITLWLAFATTLNHCLAWLFKNPRVTFLAGGAGGALSYVGAARLGTLEMPMPLLVSVPLLFMLWGVFLSLVRPASDYLKVRGATS